MDKDKLSHLPTYNGLTNNSDPEIRIAERAEVSFKDDSKCLLYVIGLREYRPGIYDIVHAIASKEGLGNKGLKFCPLEGIVGYSVI